MRRFDWDMKNNKRSLFILKYLSEQTDENHLATILQINDYLQQYELDANRETISDCIKELQEVGYDIFCVRSTQNQYYMRERPFSLAEIKLLVDAVQSSRFISKEQSMELVSKLADLVGSHKSEILKRHLYIESRAKTDNTDIMEYVDRIHRAIIEQRKVKFKYYEYTPNKEKVLRHGGQIYTVAPYVLVWNNDMYYVVGFYEEKDRVSKFRIDRMCELTLSEEQAEDIQNDLNMSDFFEKEFSMMNGKLCEVELLCENKLMSSIIDKFGQDVHTEIVDEGHFKAIVEVSLSSNFYGWVFASGGAMKIIGPEWVKTAFGVQICAFISMISPNAENP